jgi:hypothetical protein
MAFFRDRSKNKTVEIKSTEPTIHDIIRTAGGFGVGPMAGQVPRIPKPEPYKAPRKSKKQQ